MLFILDDKQMPEMSVKVDYPADFDAESGIADHVRQKGISGEEDEGYKVGNIIRLVGGMDKRRER